MHPDPIVRRFHVCFLSSLPTCLWGEPGTGKTARILSYAKARGLHLERWLLSRCESIDLKPRVYHEGKVIVGEPPEIAKLREATRSGKKGMLFLDELNRATREVEGAALDIIDAPPPDVFVAAACNPPSRGQAARSLESAAANRFVHLDVGADAKSWAFAMLAGWSVDALDSEEIKPEVAEKALKKTSAVVAGFIRRRSELLEKPPQNTAEAGKAWPSTRTWDYLRKLHATCLATDLPEDDVRAVLMGCVGSSALEYLAFFADSDLIDPEDALAHPEKFTPDAERPDRTVAAMTGIVGAVSGDLTDARWCAAWKIVERCAPDSPSQHSQADAGVVGADMLCAIYKKLRDEKDPKFAKLTVPQRLMSVRLAAIITGGK